MLNCADRKIQIQSFKLQQANNSSEHQLSTIDLLWHLNPVFSIVIHSG